MSFLDTTNLLQQYITQFLVQPLLILFLGIFLGKLLEQFLLFILAEVKQQRYGYSFFVYTVKWLVYVATIVYLLRSVHVLSIVVIALASVLCVVIVLAVLLGLKDFFPNFMKYHAVQAKHKPGAVIKTRFGAGKVVKVQLGDLHVQTNEGDDLYIPNASVREFLK